MTLRMDRLGDRALELTIDGKLREADYERLEPEVQAILARADKADLLLRVVDFDGFEPKALWKDLKFDAKHYSDFRRFAVVGERSEKWVATFSKPLTGAEVRHFPTEDLDAARRWVREGQPGPNV